MPLRPILVSDQWRLRSAFNDTIDIVDDAARGARSLHDAYVSMRTAWDLLSELGVDARCLDCGRVGPNCTCPVVP